MSRMPVGTSGSCPLSDPTSKLGPLPAGLRCRGFEGRHSIHVLGSTWIKHLPGSVRATASLCNCRPLQTTRHGRRITAPADSPVV